MLLFRITGCARSLIFIAALACYSGHAQGWVRVVNSKEKAGSAIGGGSGNTLYSGLVTGEVFRSVDNGLTWSAVTNGLVDPSGRMLLPKAFVVGANGRIIRGGDNASWGKGTGSPIFYSDNQGSTWTEVPLPFATPAVNPGGIGISDLVAHKGALYFSDLLSGGIWKSSDNGITWASVGDSLPAVSTLFVTTKTYYAVASAGDALLTVEPLRGVFRSTDGGATWSQAVQGVPGVLNSPLVSGRSWSGTDVTGSPDGTAYAVVDNAVYRSTDAGASWAQMAAGLFLARKVESLGDHVFVSSTDGRFFEGTGSADSWTELPTIPGAAPGILAQSFAAYNGALYFAGPNGIYRLDLSSATRTNILPVVGVPSGGTSFVNVGSTLRLNPVVGGTAPFTFQWLLNNTVISTDRNLSFAPNSTNQSGDLVLIVSNPAGSTTNSVGHVTVALAGPGQPDYSFRPQVLTGLFPTISVNAFAFDADGSVFYGGQNLFSITGDTYRGLRRALPDGTVDASFVTGTIGGTGSGPGTGSPVRALLPLGDGSVLVGAADTSNDARFWRRMLADGSIDATWPWPSEMAGGPWKVVQLADGKFLAGSGSNGGINRLNSDGTLDTTFIPPASIGRFQQQYVRAFALLPNGQIIIGGNFNTVDNLQRHALARVNADGALDLSFFAADIVSTRGPAVVNDMLLLPDGKLLIAGNFSTVGGQPRAGLARLNSNGTLDSTFPNLGFTDQIFTLAPQPDGKIWVGGAFTSVSGRSYLARITPDGAIDSSFPDVGLNGSVQALRFTADGRLWIGGGATTIGGMPGGQLLRIFTDYAGRTLAFAGLDQKPNLGESITLRGTVTGPYTALQWRHNGSAIPGANGLTLLLNSVTPGDSGSYDLTVTSSSGSYTSAPAGVRVRGTVVIDQQPASTLGIVSNSVTFTTAAFGKLPLTYQWLREGTAIANATNRTLTLTNLSLAQQGNYSVRVTGGDSSTATSNPAFLTVAPPPGVRDAKFNPQLFSLGFNTFSRVADFLLLPGGGIVVCGEFATNNGGSVQRMARLNADGSIDGTFQFDSTPYLEVNKLALENSGSVLAIVRLNEGGGPYEVRRVLQTGAIDANAKFPVNGFPGALQVASDGTIYVVQNQGLTRFSPAGAVDAAFTANAKTDGSVSDFSIDSSGRIYIVGNFNRVSNLARQNIARLSPDGTLDSTFAPTLTDFPTGVRVTARGILVSGNALVRLTETGARDFTFTYSGAPPIYDSMLDGGIAGVVGNPQGIITDANGRAARPVSTFPAPSSFTGGYTRFRVASDGSFYASQQTIISSNLLFHLTGTVVKQPVSDPFADWAQAAGLTGPNAAPEADPDGDGRNNITEFVLGTSPNDKKSAPSFPVSEEAVAEKHHPAVTILRRSNPGAAQLDIHVSSKVDFSDDLGSTIVSKTPLADGLERVTIRSNKAATESPQQFFRFIVRQ